MVKFYEMGNGKFIAEAGRGTTPKKIRELQKEEWTRKNGGICRIVDYTEPHALFLAMEGNGERLIDSLNIDKTKLTKFYRKIFEEYEKQKFPLTLLGKYSMWITFKDKKDLFNYYCTLSNLDNTEVKL